MVDEKKEPRVIHFSIDNPDATVKFPTFKMKTGLISGITEVKGDKIAGHNTVGDDEPKEGPITPRPASDS